MKRFLIKIVIILFTFSLCFLVLLNLKNHKIKTIDWSLPSNIHTVFMGASHIEKGINPREFPNSENIASGSERYMFTYLKLKELTKVNPQIDTLFLQFAPTDIQKNTDSKYFQKNEMSHFLPLYNPFFSLQEWKVYKKNTQESFELILQKIPRNIFMDIKSFGGFTPSEKKFDRNKEPYKMPEWLESGNTINYFYLKEIIKHCQKSNIKLIFIYMPMFNRDYFYDIDFYYNQYTSLFSNITLLDYSDWNCSDNYRADEHHLNISGANAFTKYLFANINKVQTHNNSYK